MKNRSLQLSPQRGQSQFKNEEQVYQDYQVDFNDPMKFLQDLKMRLDIDDTQNHGEDLFEMTYNTLNNQNKYLESALKEVGNSQVQSKRVYKGVNDSLIRQKISSYQTKYGSDKLKYHDLQSRSSRTSFSSDSIKLKNISLNQNLQPPKETTTETYRYSLRKKKFSTPLSCTQNQIAIQSHKPKPAITPKKVNDQKINNNTVLGVISYVGLKKQTKLTQNPIKQKNRSNLISQKSKQDEISSPNYNQKINLDKQVEIKSSQETDIISLNNKLIYEVETQRRLLFESKNNELNLYDQIAGKNSMIMQQSDKLDYQQRQYQCSIHSSLQNEILSSRNHESGITINYQKQLDGKDKIIQDYIKIIETFESRMNKKQQNFVIHQNSQTDHESYNQNAQIFQYQQLVQEQEKQISQLMAEVMEQQGSYANPQKIQTNIETLFGLNYVDQKNSKNVESDSLDNQNQITLPYQNSFGEASKSSTDQNMTLYTFSGEQQSECMTKESYLQHQEQILKSKLIQQDNEMKCEKILHLEQQLYSKNQQYEQLSQSNQLEIQDFKFKLEELTKGQDSEISQLGNTQIELKDKIIFLQKQTQDLIIKINEKQDQIAQITLAHNEQLEQLQKEKSVAKNKSRDLTESRKFQEPEKSQLDESEEQLKRQFMEQLRIADSKLLEMKKSALEQDEINNNLSNSTLNLQEQLKNQMRIIKVQQQKMMDDQQTYNLVTEKQKDYLSTIQSLKLQIADLHDKKNIIDKQYNEDHTSRIGQIEKLNQQVTELHQQLITASTDVEQLHLRISLNNQAIKTTQDEKMVMEQENQDLNKSLQLQILDCNDLRKELQNKLQLYQAKLQENTQRIAEIQKKNLEDIQFIMAQADNNSQSLHESSEHQSDIFIEVQERNDQLQLIIRHKDLEIINLQEQNDMQLRLIEENHKSDTQKPIELVSQLTQENLDYYQLLQDRDTQLKEKNIEISQLQKVFAYKEMWLYYYRKQSREQREQNFMIQNVNSDQLWMDRVDELMREIHQLQNKLDKLETEQVLSQQISEKKNQELKQKNIEVEMWRMNVQVLEQQVFQRKK